MTKDEMTSLLTEHIPLCQFMQLRVTLLDGQSIHTAAPFAPNRNIHNTVFAGALYSLAVATGWSLVYNALKLAGLDGHLVVKDAVIHYKRPVEGDITLSSTLPQGSTSAEAIAAGLECGKLRFPLVVNISYGDRICASLEATYVAVLHIRQANDS
jgi:thioesterase domain-containing protein